MFKSVILTEYPTGRFVFVGRVPVVLGYERLDGKPVTKEDARDLAHVGPVFLRHRLRPRSWATKEEAEAARAGVEAS